MSRRSSALMPFAAFAACTALSGLARADAHYPNDDGTDVAPLGHGTPMRAAKVYNFRLDDPSATRGSFPLLDAFADASVDQGAGLRRYLRGLRERTPPWWTLTFAKDAEDASEGTSETTRFGESFTFNFDSQDVPELGLSPSAMPAWLDPSFKTPFVKTQGAVFAFNGFDALWSLPPSKPIPNWRCRRRPVRMARYSGESDAFLLVRCDGTAALEAFDRLTLMARETTAPRPGALLPDEPDATALTRGEWSPGVRLVHPRLLWVIQRIADAFPWRTIYVFSGYRHDPSGVKPKPGSHHSMHSEGRAMDIYVMGVPNAALYQVCHKLEDVGCGYYPNSKFVHVDVRMPGSGHPFWIDVSQPGEPSHYVDAWPGVIESGALVWQTPATDAKRPR